MENNNYFKMIFNDMRTLWSKLDISQKFGIATLTAITLVMATYFFIKATEPNWTVLYSGLSEQDSIAITESLKKSGYAYKLSSDKGSVLVPANQQEELRVYVAENDLIQDQNPGFELLDTLQLGTTDFKNKMTKQRIFQGEITRSIEKINGIKKARVQLAEPEKSVFSDNDDSPSASVVLILEPGYKLKAAQIKAVKNLVAYGVPRLQPEKVFLTDQYGNTLSDDPAKNSGDMESYKAGVEADAAKKIQTVLEKIVGKQNVNVQVSADIDFNTARSTIESYLPSDKEDNTGVLAQSQSESETYEKPQVVSDQQTGEEEQQNLQNPKNLNYQKQRNTTSYNVSKEVKQIIYAPGTIKRMTIAVAVNKILTEDEEKQLKELIQTAGGADLSRGDVINITSMEFSSLSEGKDAQQEMMDQMNKQSSIDFWVTKIAPLGVVLILGLAALFVLKSLLDKIGIRSNVVKSWDNDDDNVATTIKDELSDMLSVEALPQIEPQLDPELERMKTSLNDTILADPAEASRILISYIKD